jgi:hypothetical protein
MIIFYLFLFALVLSIIAQIISYRSGPRINSRLFALGFGIAAVILLGVAGRIGLRDLRQFVEFIDAVYLLPRTVTPKQAGDLRAYSAHHLRYPLIVKVNGGMEKLRNMHPK